MPVGLMVGDTENSVVITALLADLVAGEEAVDRGGDAGADATKICIANERDRVMVTIENLARGVGGI